MQPSSLPTALRMIGNDIDPRAQVFAAGDRVLRAIRPGHEEEFAVLIESPCIRELIGRGLLIDTHRSAEVVAGSQLVLEHPRLRYVTYPFEWTPSMLRDAARAILELQLALAPHGYALGDARPWNVLFDGCRPVFVDFSAIVRRPAHGCWEQFAAFEDFCVHPLRVMAQGFPTLARVLLREQLRGVDWTVPSSLLANPRRYEQRPHLDRWLGRAGDYLRHLGAKVARRFSRNLPGPAARERGASTEEMRALLAWLDDLALDPPAGFWSDYYHGKNGIPRYDGESTESNAPATEKERVLDEWLTRLRPATVLDLACNRGLYSLMASRLGATVAGVDTDERALELLHAEASTRSDRVTPLYVDAIAPAEAIGLQGLPVSTVRERLASDCVLCLALVHHLVFKTGLRLPHIARWLAGYTHRHAIVEFVCPGDHYLNDERPRTRPDYTLESFEAALATEFVVLERRTSSPATRVLFLLERKA